MIIDEDDYLMHYGVLRKSGRYPWGSGETQSARNRTFLDTVEGLRKQGMSESDIAKGFDMTTTQLRALKSIAGNEQKQAQINRAQQLKDKQMSNIAIGSAMGINESSVRSLLDAGAKERAEILLATSNMLKRQVDEKRFVDIGTGVENHLGISNTKLKTAVAVLEEEGYAVHTIQVDTGIAQNKTLVKVLAPPGTTYRDIVTAKDQIRQIQEHSDDGGRSFLGMMAPLSISSSRVGIRYAEDGGSTEDGVIHVRPGVPDVSLGHSRYAQVRIAVDGTHYIKGMAVYKDDLPPGVDLVFNTNKSDKGNKLKALKPMKADVDGNVDPDNPFGAIVRQLDNGLGGSQRKITSAMNIVNEEADWDKWSKTLSTQLLSKQSPVLAKQQLDVTFARRKADLDEIMSLTNPAVKRKLLESYADGADSASVHLKAAALPGQATHVILPVNTLKPTEIYAPNFKNGERVALVRYPHGGTFEIPELTVNNNHPEAKALLGRATSAVGIHHKVAERLSGADFDGDTVLVIPNSNGQIKTTAALAGLKNFDPQKSYPPYDGMKTMGGGTWDAKSGKEVFPPGKGPSGRTKGTQMGLVSNLITDMTIKAAPPEELARAVRHSMVVIDAEKHHLDYKASAAANGIPQLYKKYQGRSQGGASTLISRATSPLKVAERTERSARDGGRVDTTTGKIVYTPTGNSYVNKQGKTVLNTSSTTKLAEATDAHTLSSGTRMESIYADHSNRLKALADKARLEAVRTESVPYSPSAKAAYSTEVKELQSALNLVRQNRPRERQAQLLANTIVSQKRAAYPDMEPSELKKIKGQALKEARLRAGAEKHNIHLTDGQWAAIQAGAITNHTLSQILQSADLDRVRELATPRASSSVTSGQLARAKTMLSAGYTQADVAMQLGVSVSTLTNNLKD